jgi:acyl-CoA dehydrogenase
MHDASSSWELPQDLVMLRDTVRAFMADKVRPAEQGIDPDAIELPQERLAPLQKEARALGLWCIESPAEYGGAGLNLLAQAIVAEEASKCRLGLYFPAADAFGIDPPNIVFRGNADQIARYGVPGIQSARRAFVAISEASGGADPARAIKTRAARSGDRYIVNGAKMWISGAGQADWGVLFARTGDAGRGGITAFILDRDTPGMTKKVIPVIRSYSPYELFFKDAEIPVANRLGEEGQGFSLAGEWLVHSRVPYAAGCLGVAQHALEMAIAYAKEREVFRSKLAEKQAIQWMIADSEVELRAARLLIWQAAWRGDLGRDIKTDASIAKLCATETAGRVVDRCIQIFGGLGVAKELPLERWYRELRIKRIGEGPSEVHRMVIAREMLG